MIQSDHCEFKFSVDLMVYTGHLFMRTVFSMKSAEDLKSKHKPGSDYYYKAVRGKKRNLRN